MFNPELLRLSGTNTKQLATLIKMLHTYKTDNELDCACYLFGSFAKRCISTYSDIDVLVICEEDISREKCRELRHQIEDYIYDNFKDREVDVKLYSRNHFMHIVKSDKTSFERSISTQLIRLF